MKMKFYKFFFLSAMISLVSCSPNSASVSDDYLKDLNNLLDGLHQDAHEGNFNTYFGRYSADAIFLGTDKTERWTIEEFKIYAKSAFEDGHGWSYEVIERNWEGDSDIRWFDEILFNEKLGHCRGTGVVQLINDEWKIAHYALTMLVPNSIASEIGRQTQDADKKILLQDGFKDVEK